MWNSVQNKYIFLQYYIIVFISWQQTGALPQTLLPPPTYIISKSRIAPHHPAELCFNRMPQSHVCFRFTLASCHNSQNTITCEVVEYNCWVVSLKDNPLLPFSLRYFALTSHLHLIQSTPASTFLFSPKIAMNWQGALCISQDSKFQHWMEKYTLFHLVWRVCAPDWYKEG